MAGIFQQQVSGGDTVYRSKQGVEDKHTSELVGFIGTQALEARRGHSDAKLQGEVRGIAEERIMDFDRGTMPGANARMAGTSTELDTLGSEVQGYQNAVNQGYMTNSQMEVRVELARKRALNRMPGRADDINKLTMQTLGEYQARLDIAKQGDVAQTKDTEWADKQFRTAAAKIIPLDVALYQPIPEILAGPYGSVLKASYRQEQAMQQADFQMKMNTLDTQEADKLMGEALFGQAASMQGRHLNIASIVTKGQITDLKDVPVELRGQVIAQMKRELSDTIAASVGAFGSKGNFKYYERAAILQEKLELDIAYMKGDMDTEVYAGQTANIVARAEFDVYSRPGNAIKIVSLAKLSNLPILPQNALAWSEDLTRAINLMVPGASSSAWGSPQGIKSTVNVLDVMGKQKTLDPNAKEVKNSLMQNLADKVDGLDSDSVWKFLNSMADPQKVEMLRENAGEVTTFLDTASLGMATKLINGMESQGMTVTLEGDSFLFTGSDPRTNREMNSTWGIVLRNMKHINDNISASSNFDRLLQTIGVDANASTNTTTDSTSATTASPPSKKNSKGKSLRPPTDQEYNEFMSFVNMTMDTDTGQSEKAKIGEIERLAKIMREERGINIATDFTN